MTRLDALTRTRRERMATDLFLTGRARRRDAWLSLLYFNLDALTWAELAERPVWAGAIDEALAALPARPSAVLDVGCGTGSLAARAAEQWPEATVIGLDAAVLMVRTAGRLHRAPNLTFRRGTLTRLPYPDGRFDLVALMNCLPVPEEIGRVTAAGGHVVCAATTPFGTEGDELFLSRWREAGLELEDEAADRRWRRFVQRLGPR